MNVTLKTALDREIEVEVDYIFTPESGGSWDCPPDPSELEIHSIEYRGRDITQWISEKNMSVIKDKIYEYETF